ncbi:GtrA family protein [uncultured Gemmiger sp.]|uniref:GtrA family protein n=1 Tax=uncultured Gemmiger sp. TaxID=1623490 RepID=UPI0025E7D391|nr:GtrA family protein [uncultured Gemmiger sp.]
MSQSVNSQASRQPFWRFLVSSLSSSVVDLAAFQLLCIVLRAWMTEALYILLATVLARVLSSLVNYLLNYFLVFHSHAHHAKSASLYTTITVLKTLLSAVLVSVIAGAVPAGIPELGIKIPVDVLLFFFNYLLQKRLVY